MAASTTELLTAPGEVQAMKKSCSTIRVLKHHNKFPGQAGDTPAGVQGALDDTIDNMLKLLVSPEVVMQLGLISLMPLAMELLHPTPLHPLPLHFYSIPLHSIHMLWADPCFHAGSMG